ncbi:hypothetical protein [Pyxidicoccus trucidator]|uniref:hypothetical protein n=1 Tax=Pyxidicoccus trucidator TaxID=2709662 RepID=UPI0013D997C9|nr:hypothetical protein [Pyxidicoccus trucidator]
MLLESVSGGPSLTFRLETNEEEARPAADVGVCPPGAVPEEGLAAFRAACAQCHVNSDGWDLAHFGYSDAAIVRRASAHVDTTTACSMS